MKLLMANSQEGETVLVDAADYPALTSYRWQILRQCRDGYTKKYVVTYLYDKSDWRKRTTVYLHRLLMQPGDGLVIDHINGDGLDNRRLNLRVVTKSQNALNRNFGRSGFNKNKYPIRP
jgi:hypothetical protein